ncbi:acylneuraminate cytidylyltransferase family protein [Pseudoalteromonas sp. OOF1S-7]|uniref:acylneuraminate cytidylyltransferase family protein n=1 Tax=Pseudoalteromonas sp. OOF1S-7 TaxID=2917757 RepID=UPI001EF4AE54|nr:acylneuraminate cytidylyltransferase family protein [Pseudoalteromonas sp. OOF1S-7]MCG7536353.1 acylneuraminate cytidylyltransferase family protein [Pseudoalteromonas sp. OOF1S-7]
MSIALITARGGSKGLPRKNVYPLNGIPLIGWTIKAALDSHQFSGVYVSTDDNEIAEVSREYGAQVIVRPGDLASDTAGSEPVIAHAISVLEETGLDFDTMVLLQPTSPLRTSSHIKSAIETYKKENASLVLSVFEPHHTPVKAYVETEGGHIVGLYSAEAPYSRRQDLPRAFQPNGAIYVFNVDEFKKRSQFPRTDVFPFIMSHSESADIDTLEDLLNVEKLIKSNEYD